MLGVQKKIGGEKKRVTKSWGYKKIGGEKKNKDEKKVGESGLRSSESCSPEGYGDP